MSIHPRCFHLHRLFTCFFARLLLERHADLVKNKNFNLRPDVLGNIVSSRLLYDEDDVLIIWAAALVFVP